MLAKVDGAIFDLLFQPFSDWFQRVTGKSCFFLSKVSFVVSIFALIGDAAYHNFSLVIMAFNTVLIMLIGGTIYSKIENERNFDFSSDGERFMNPKRISIKEMHSRIIWLAATLLFLLPVLVYHKIGEAWFPLFALFYSIGLYFNACTPLPPSKSKVRIWADKLKEAAQGLFAPVREPIRVENN